MTREIWKAHPEGRYAASNKGRIKQVIASRKIKAKTILVPHEDDGYMRVSLHVGGKRKIWGVHRFIMLVWKGSCPPGKEVNHKDGIKTNNKLKNLEYLTPKENTQHAYVNGLKIPIIGENNPKAKLSKTDINAIRNLYRTKCITQTKLAKKFNISQRQISQIVRYASWA